MQMFRALYVLLCFHVIFLRYTYCKEVLFECNENEQSIISQHVCTLDTYSCTETAEFSMQFNSWNQPKRHIYDLWFKNSTIYYIPNGIFSHLPNLQSLHLTGCNVLELSRYDFKSAINLLQINLSYNNLTVLPDSSFNGAENLENLNLAHNRITNINTNAFKSLSKLTHINLSSNQIVTIPDNLFAHFIAMEDIDLSENLIISFVESFDTENYFTLNLNRLNLNSNQITNLTFASTIAINELTINNNELMAINLNQNSVKILRADNNKLQNTGLSISDCDLTELSLKNNSLLDFNFIRNMSNLTELDLSFNMDGGQTIASDTFAKLTNLISLRLESVNLQQLDFQMFSKLMLLELLDISYNNLNSIDFHMLSLLANLKWLYINGNSLTNLRITEFEFLFPNLNVIDISDNNWQCDQLADILRKLRQINIKSTVDAERLVTSERNILGIRCYQNGSDWDNVTKIPLLRIQQHNEGVATELNQTKLRLNELQQQNENVKFELTEILNEIDLERNETKSQMNVLQQENMNLKLEMEELLKEFNRTLETNQIALLKSDKLVQIHEAGGDNNHDGIGLAGDIQFIKIVQLLFLVAGICVLGLKCYGMFFKRTPLWLQRFHPSTNTMTSTIEENNI